MIAYELYLLIGAKRYELIGILPERRKDPDRITKESVLKWGRMVLGNGADTRNIIIKQMRIDDVTGQVSEVKTYFDDQLKNPHEAEAASFS
ncbi:MAG: hypothetical protein ACE144_11435 [Thermodesulfobacteriota bacterium]